MVTNEQWDQLNDWLTTSGVEDAVVNGDLTLEDLVEWECPCDIPLMVVYDFLNANGINIVDKED